MSAAQAVLPSPLPSPPPTWNRICGTGEMADLIRRTDWGATTLGDPALWPESLLAAVNLILSSPIPSSVYWGPRHVLLYNDGYRQFVAHRHPALGKPGAEVWKEAWHIVGPQIEHTYRTGETFHSDSLLVPIERNGRLVDHHWNYSFSPIYDARTGRVAGIYNTSTDVTGAFCTARERDSLAQRLRDLLETTSEGVIMIDRNWRFTYLNRAAEEFSLPIAGLVGKVIWEALPRLVYEGSPNVYHYHRAMDHGIASEFDSFYPEPMNRWRHIQVRPTADGIVLFARDITEQKRADAAIKASNDALAASEEELRWTVRMNTQNPWTADSGGKLVSGGDILLEHPGQPSEWLLEKDWTETIHPEDESLVHEAWNRSMRTGETFDVEHRRRTASEEFHWLRARAYPRRDAEGRIVKWYGTTEDIHARKTAEEGLRTSEKLAAVGRLATSIAHEINNPLEAVTNLLYLARTSGDLPEVLGYIETAEQELHRASVIANQTLRFQRQSSAPIALYSDDLIENCLAVFQGKLQNSFVVAERRLRALQPVICYDGEIRQVFLNLVGNAIDAMQPGGGRLLIRTREATHPATGERGLVLTVADTGSGIPPEAQKRLFEPFFTTKGIGGTGLGLWVSKDIVARHKGTLRLRSKPRHRKTDLADGGTVFTLFLPFDALRESASSLPAVERLELAAV